MGGKNYIMEDDNPIMALKNPITEAENDIMATKML